MPVTRDVLEAIHQRRSGPNPGSDLFATIDPYVLTAAETAAGITPTNFSYIELDARRYGVSASATATANTTALQAAVSVLAHHAGGELVIPEGLVASINQVTFSSLSNFNVRCDGALVSAASQPGTAFTDQRSTFAGQFSPLNFSSCSNFKIYGKGYIQPGFVEPIFLSTCTDFDLSLDLRGNATNSTLCGLYIRFCSQFRVHDMTIDSITAQNMNNSTEVFFTWLNNVQIWDSFDFMIYRVISRKAGMNGFYPASNCYEFSITHCIAELNSGSGIQPAWSSFGVFPIRFDISHNILRYNQADGLDVNNTSGSSVNIFATFMGNIHAYNGWINCNPANAAGSDGSGVGTFENVNNFEAIGNTVTECAHTGIFVSNCSEWRITHNAVLKSNTGTAADGVFISAGTSGSLAFNDIKVPSTLNALNMQSTNDVTISNCSFDGLISLANGSYPGCKMTSSRISSTAVLNWVFDYIDCNITVTGGSAQGLIADNPSVRAIRCAISSPGSAINTNSVNYCVAEDCLLTTTGAAACLLVNASNGCRVNGNLATSTSAAAIQTLGACDRTFISNNKANSASGNSLNISAGSTNTLLLGLTVIAGPTSLGGTYLINQP